MLTVMATLLVVAGVALGVRMAQQTGDQQDRYAVTQKRIERIQEALHGFAAANGVLGPCPANGAADTGLAEPVGISDPCTHLDGVVPWRTLGLPSDDALDGWGRKFSYRVATGNDGRPCTMSTISCDVNKQSGPPWMTAADFGVSKAIYAWVAISHGPTGQGAWLPGGQRKGNQPKSLDELKNLRGPDSKGFVRREERVLDLEPETSPDYFDDIVSLESRDDLLVRSGWIIKPGDKIEDKVVRFSREKLAEQAKLEKNENTGKNNLILVNNSNTSSVYAVDISTSGESISLSGKEELPRPNVSYDNLGIGVCSGLCNNDASAVLDKNKFLNFRKIGGPEAKKFAIGVYSLEEKVEAKLTFQKDGALVGTLNIAYPSLPSHPKKIAKGSFVAFPNLRFPPVPPPATPPTSIPPAQEFDEVKVQPTGTSRFFISAIRFCRENESCT